MLIVGWVFVRLGECKETLLASISNPIWTKRAAFKGFYGPLFGFWEMYNF